jgi:hypothetical protein
MDSSNQSTRTSGTSRRAYETPTLVKRGALSALTGQTISRPAAPTTPG